MLNRYLDRPLNVSVKAGGFSGLSVERAHQLEDQDLDAVNSKDAPDRIKPSQLEAVRLEGGKLSVELRPASWNVIRLSTAG